MEEKQRKVAWGDLGLITYARTYARPLKNGQKENFSDTVDRELKGISRQLKLELSDSEQEFYKDMRHNMWGSVAGRFMWQLGTKTVDDLGLPSLQNCAFVVIDDPIRPFTWAMDMLMLGSGVGYSIKREHVYKLPKVHKKRIKIEKVSDAGADFIVPDSREGWVKLLGKVLKAYFYSGEGFTYSTQLVRGSGEPIEGFGGTASGPNILVEGMELICGILDKRRNAQVRPIDCLDMMNIIGMIVVAGNVRRSAQIAIGDYDDLEYLKAKTWRLGNIPNWRAMSNNSVDVKNVKDLPEEFWDTYREGEPYGLINLDLSRKIGRLGETQYPDPEVEGYNPCFHKDTLITTKEGLFPIKELVGKKVEILSTDGWREIDNFRVTAKNEKVLQITLQDGSDIKVTPYHTMILENGDKVKSKDLSVGDKLMISSVEVDGDISTKGAYIKGFLCADGTLIKDSRPYIYLYPPKYICESRIIKSANEIGDLTFNTNSIKELSFIDQKYKSTGRRVLHGLTPKKDELAPWCNVYKKKLPTEVFSWDRESKCNFLAGLFDGDGSSSDTSKGFMYQLSSVEKKFLKDVQTLLKTIGVYSKFSLMHKSTKKDFNDGYGEYSCKNSYRLTISQKSSITFSKQVSLERLVSFKDKTVSYNIKPKYNKVVDIREHSIQDEVYCCTVEGTNAITLPIGIMVGQCAEQSLANHETCSLAEIYLPNIKDYETFKRVMTMLYRINKHALALKCHHQETEDIVHKNMRMGIGITGVMMSSEEQLSWLNPAYTYLRAYDKEYSKQQGFPESIKLTTIKPSGTLSLLAGVTSGVHPATAGQYFIRRIRISSGSALIAVIKSHGYHIEYQKNFDGTEDKSTMVAEFPCKYPDGVVSADDMTVFEQLDMVKYMQEVWSDNSVSVTAYYKKEELPELREYLEENFNDNFKTLSFLLYSGHGFVQAPFEPITKEQYEYLSGLVRPIETVSINEEDVEELGACGIGGCPIK